MSKAKVIIISIVFLIGVGAVFAQTTLLHEEFEAAFPPAGWSTGNDGQGDNQWASNTSYGRPNYTPGGNGKCADNDDAAAGNNSRCGDNWLSTSAIDATYYGIVWVAFDLDWYPGPGETALQAKVEVFNGTSWSLIKSYPLFRTTTRDSINISTHVANKSTGKVRWLYNETSGGVTSNWFEIDDVDVWGSDYEPPPPPDTLDLSIVQIIRPNDHEEPGIPFVPSCVVHNNLDTTAHAQVSCTITDIQTQEVVHEDVLDNVSCLPNNTTVEFEPFTPMANKTYNARFEVYHPDDPYPENNTMMKNFNTFTYDVTPIELIWPKDPQGGPFDPTADFAERAGQLTRYVYRHCVITTLDSVPNQDTLYDVTLETTTFQPLDTLETVFPTCTLYVGTFIITFWADGESQPDISHPPLVDTFDYLAIEEAPVESSPVVEIFPNPATKNASINFVLTQTGNVTLTAYDATGSLVNTVYEGILNPGAHSLIWDTRDVFPGVYFVRLRTSEHSLTLKLTVIH